MNIKLTFAMVCMLFLLTACPTSNLPVSFNPYQGSEGVTLEFATNGPPPKVFANETFNVIAKIQNKGAYNASAIFFDLIYDTYYFEAAELRNSPNPNADRNRAMVSLEGKTFYNPQGSFTTEEFLLRAKPIEGERESPTSTILFNLCYPYQTRLAAEVCLDSDPFNMDVRKKTCSALPKMYSNQGAPVAITKIEPRMTVKRGSDTEPTMISPTFTITFKNLAKGIIIQKTTADLGQQCTLTDTNKTLWGKADVAARISDKPMSCTPSTLNFVNDEATTTCRLQNDQDGFMTIQFLTQPDVLLVTLDYLYLSAASKTVTISR
jgi:hypothetical protein